MNYRNLTTKELLMNASNKDTKGILVPIACELASRLEEAISSEAYEELQSELDKLKTDYEI